MNLPHAMQVSIVMTTCDARGFPRRRRRMHGLERHRDHALPRPRQHDIGMRIAFIGDA
jgi:hypothetical protein